MDITVKPLAPHLLDVYLYFFDSIVFIENPDWERCYCYSFHFTGADEQWNKKDNRAAVSKTILRSKKNMNITMLSEKN